MAFHICDCGSKVEYQGVNPRCPTCGTRFEGELPLADDVAAVNEVAPMVKVISDGNVFDPEIHHVEHRGGGRWFVMRGEEKCWPVSKKEAKRLENL